MTHHLTAPHSSIELLPDVGFRLYRADRLIFASGRDWGNPAVKLLTVMPDGISSVATYQTDDDNTIALKITPSAVGWHFAWDAPTTDTFSITAAGHWYGMGELMHQFFPLEKMTLPIEPFITWDNGFNGVGDIIAPTWITSSGAALVMPALPGVYDVGFNTAPSSPTPERKLFNVSLEYARVRPYPAADDADGLLTLRAQEHPLSYTLLAAEDAVGAFHAALTVTGHPTQPPPDGLLTAPIWTSWARYKAEIDQDKIVAFADEIRAHGFTGGTLEIDDKWQGEYGDTAFSPARFPDPAAMVRELNARGFAVTVWITPFINPASSNAQPAIDGGFLVKRPDGQPYIVRWWQGEGYLLDVTNPDALEWWRGRLQALKDSVGLAGYKFDAGEANFLPADAVTHQPIIRSEYSTRWVQFAAANFPFGEVRCGWFNQRETILFRQFDKFSTWGLENGLHSVVTTALSMSMAGYPYSLPDMVGGNAYGDVVADKELLIRWTQASAPMLSMQFSLAPWDFDAETVEICARYAQLHVDLTPIRLEAARQTADSGEPVIRPIFWLDATDGAALNCDDEYLLGDRFLVAPVVKQGAVSRDVYLPRGQWRDYWTGAIYEAGWLHDFPAPLDVLPLFERVG